MPTMDEHLHILEMTVAEVLKAEPAASSFFIGWHTDCVGCRLAHFCTLEEVIRVYEFDENKFMEELSKFNLQTNQIRRKK